MVETSHFEVLHGVVDRHTVRNRPSGAVDIQVDILVRILPLKIEELCDYNACCRRIDLIMQKNDTVIKKPGENIVGTFSVVALLYYIRNISHKAPFPACAAACAGFHKDTQAVCAKPPRQPL